MHINICSRRNKQTTIFVCSQLLMYYVKWYGPRSDCSHRSCLIRVHSVCFHVKSVLECIWIYAADAISRQHFYLLFVCTLVANIAKNIDPDQTAPIRSRLTDQGAVWSGFMVFASTVNVFWSAYEYMQQTQYSGFMVFASTVNVFWSAYKYIQQTQYSGFMVFASTVNVFWSTYKYLQQTQ